MMFFHFAFLLCWAIIAIIAVRGQQIDQNIAAATVNIPASTSDKIVVAGEALLARWADQDEPIADPEWEVPIVLPWPDSQSQPPIAPSALHHPNPYLKTATASSNSAVEALSIARAPSYTSTIPSAATLSSVWITGISLTTVPTLSARATSTSTIIVLTTVLIQPTPQSAIIQASPPSTTNESSTQSIQPTVPRTMPATLQIGLSVGVAICILSLVILASFYLWRHRKKISCTPKSERRTNMFRLGAYEDNKDDAEWSIESAEKVAIVGNVRAQSVLTVSRSNSRRSNAGNESGAISGGRSGKVQTVALSSHPMTPSYTAFDKADDGVRNAVLKSDVKEDGEERKAGSWPLEK